MNHTIDCNWNDGLSCDCGWGLVDRALQVTKGRRVLPSRLAVDGARVERAIDEQFDLPTLQAERLQILARLDRLISDIEDIKRQFGIGEAK